MIQLPQPTPKDNKKTWRQYCRQLRNQTAPHQQYQQLNLTVLTEILSALPTDAQPGNSQNHPPSPQTITQNNQKNPHHPPQLITNNHRQRNSNNHSEETTNNHKQGVTIAAFLSYGSEPDTWPLLEAALSHGYRILVPTATTTSKQPTWTRLSALPAQPQSPGTDTKTTPTTPTKPPRRPYCPHPPGTTPNKNDFQNCQLILLPALAVDYSGTRLGQGGGWYDRALNSFAPSAHRLALVHENEIWPANTLPKEPHDQSIHGIWTPQRHLLLPTN